MNCTVIDLIVLILFLNEFIPQEPDFIERSNFQCVFPNGKGKGKDETTPGQLLLTHSPAVQGTSCPASDEGGDTERPMSPCGATLSECQPWKSFPRRLTGILLSQEPPPEEMHWTLCGLTDQFCHNTLILISFRKKLGALSSKKFSTFYN